MVVKWCSPNTLTMSVRIPLKPAVFNLKIDFEKNKNKQKEAGDGLFFKKECQRQSCRAHKESFAESPTLAVIQQSFFQPFDLKQANSSRRLMYFTFGLMNQPNSMSFWETNVIQLFCAKPN